MSLNTNIVAYWKTDESSGNAADSVASYTLTNNNTVAYDAGKIFNGADFGSSNTNKTLTNTALTVIDGGAVSISLWVKLNTEITSGSYGFFNIGNNTSSKVDYYIGYNYNSGTPQLVFERHKQGGADQGAAYTITLGTTNWYQLVLTYDGVNINGYVNASSVIAPTAASGNGTSADSYTGFTLGLNPRIGGSYTSAHIDEIGVWSRALTTGEVTQLYAGGLGIQYPFSYFWVGGTGTWDTSTSTHWSSTSGGAGGAGVPTSTTPVVFDANSGTGITNTSGTISCSSINCTGFAGILGFNDTTNISGDVTFGTLTTIYRAGDINIGGSLTLGATMAQQWTGTLTFNSTATGKTITSNGHQFQGAIVFNGIGGAWTLQDALNIGSYSSLTITNGTLNTGGNIVNASSISNSGTLNLGASAVSIYGNGTTWSCPGTLSPGTSTLEIYDNAVTSNSVTFDGQGKTYNNVKFNGTGTGAFIIQGSNTFNDLKCITPPHTIQFTAGTIQKLQTFTVNGTAGNLMTLQSTSNGSPWYLEKISPGNVSSDYLSLQDSYVTSI